jgi:hypothetical protein
MSDRESSGELQSEPPPAYGTDAERFARVVRTIEGEIVPRLLMSFVAPLQAGHRLEAALLRRRHEDVRELARLLLNGDSRAAGVFIQAILSDENVFPDRVCLELLAPAAHRLRELWETRECNFGEFATGMERLLGVLRLVTESATDECSTAGL